MSDLKGYEFTEESGRQLDLFNILTILILVLTGLMLECYATIFVAPGIVVPERFRPNPQLLELAAAAPTETPTPTETPKLGALATWTMTFTPEPSISPTPRGTATHTLTPSLTPTWIPTKTPTPTPTFTNTPTDTPTPGPSPTPAPTRSDFPFTVEMGSPTYIQNWANNAGCNWLGVAGQVFDLQGSPVPNGAYMIWVHPPVDYQTFTGGALNYGPSGWEVYLNDRPQVATYRIQLFSPAGTPVSAVFEFQTWASCTQNLVIINFVQNH